MTMYMYVVCIREIIYLFIPPCGWHGISHKNIARWQVQCSTQLLFCFETELRGLGLAGCAPRRQKTA